MRAAGGLGCEVEGRGTVRGNRTGEFRHQRILVRGFLVAGTAMRDDVPRPAARLERPQGARASWICISNFFRVEVGPKWAHLREGV